MGRTEEIQYLRETLQRTREKLEQEQRLNSAIKAKKVNLKIHNYKIDLIRKDGLPLWTFL